MRKIVLVFGAVVPLVFAHARGGSIVTISDKLESDGHLTLNPSAIHVKGSAPADIDLSDVLEANFTDANFHLDYFSTRGPASSQLPSVWKAKDIPSTQAPGSVVFANGIFTLSGSGTQVGRKSVSCLFAGQPWTGNGEWTVRLEAVAAENPLAEAGIMLRESLAAESPQIAFGASPRVSGGQVDNPGAILSSSMSGKRPTFEPAASVQLPVWLRLTRSGNSVESATSEDAQTWQIVSESTMKFADSTWVGLFLDSRKENILSKATLDQVTFTPGPCFAQIAPAGVVLTSGSFLAGPDERMETNPNKPADGNFRLVGRKLVVPSSEVAAVTLHPIAWQRLTDAASQTGVIMKNGDVLSGDISAVNGGGVTVNSLLVGIVHYQASDVLACVFHPVQPLPAPYEIRLTDGSDILATAVSQTKTLLTITEVSGLNMNVAPEEIAQFRAGTAQVQNLLELPWKAVPAGAAAPTATTAASPAANATPDSNSGVQCWQGENQEQIMEVPRGAAVNFPLTGPFRALVLRFAVSPDSPANAEITMRILVDGREVGRTPPVKLGDQPRLAEVTCDSPRTVTLAADSFVNGAKVLVLDPIAIRSK